jgi:hypothetical protein
LLQGATNSFADQPSSKRYAHMANSRKPGPLQSPIGMCVIPARTPGPLGMFDQGDPNVTSALGDTPGPLGYNDANDPSISVFGPALGVPRRLGSLAELNVRGRIRAMRHGEAFFTFHPVGRALHGYAESALAITRSPLTLAEGVGNLLNDAYGYSRDQLAGPKTGVMGDARPYSAASGLLQSIQRDGWLGTTGNIVRGTMLSLPGIAQIDAMNRRDPRAFGASLPATFLALSGRMAAGQGGASRSGGTMVKKGGSEPAPKSRTSNANGTPDARVGAPQGAAKGNHTDSVLADVAGPKSAVVQLEIRSAAVANEAMVVAGNQPAWLSGSYVAKQIVPTGTQYQMVVSEAQAQALARGESWFGNWATPNKVPSQSFARNKLSILPEFKPDVSFVVTVETTAPQTLNSGFAGALGGYNGTAAQVEFLEIRNLKIIGSPQLLPQGK